MKSKFWKVLSLVLVVVFLVTCASTLIACKDQKGDDNKGSGEASKLVVAYSNFSEKFSPFFATSSFDVDVAGLTQVGLLAGDRVGDIVKNGIEGEKRTYNGTEYTYYGLSDITVTINDDGTVDYAIKMRKDVKFSDGTPVTIKDVIFTMYVYSDMDYDGSTTFFSLPIEGMNEWRANLRTDVLESVTEKAKALKASYDADEEDFVFDEEAGYTQAEFDSFTGKFAALWEPLAEEIVAYVKDSYAGTEYVAGGTKYSGKTAIDFTVEGQKIAAGMAMWGFGSFDTDYAVDAQGTFGLVDGEYKTLYTPTNDEDLAMFSDGQSVYTKLANIEEGRDAKTAYTIVKKNDEGTYQVAEYTGERYKVAGYQDSFTDSVIGKKYDMVTEFPTIADYAECIKAAYAGDPFEAWDVEKAYTDKATAAYEAWIAETGKTLMNGESVKSISGITYDLDAYTINVKTTEFSATTIYNLSLYVTPMHYYGDTSKWDPANGSYGFTRGNLDSVRSKTTKPMGAGPYKFVSYKDGIVTFEANENYWEGTPKIKNIMFKEYSKDEDKTPAVISGEVDIATPSINDDVVKLIKQENGSDRLVVDGSLKIATDLVDFNGYGYLGMNSENIKVGSDKGSAASKSLRKAFATLFAAYRAYTVNSYYKERASVIEYPISNCSWAAPQPADDGYAIAFSKDAQGNDIYTADMTEEQKWAAALNAAKTFFVAAGYTYDEGTGKFTAAPEGAKMSYEAIIGGGGTGDHPTFALLNKASEALATIGIELRVTDISNSSDLFAKMEAGTAEIFVAAWGGSADPDMYQVYHSDNKTNSNHYRIADETLDAKIIAARKSPDTSYRKQVYKDCLDIILDWAVELPVYQRKECTIYNSSAVKISSLTPDTTPYWTYLAEIYKLEVNK